MHSTKLATCIMTLAASLLTAQAACAQAAIGTVNNLTGTLVARGIDGKVRVLGVHSEVREGDTLATWLKSYARVVFTDDAEVILQPDSMLVLTRYAYDADRPLQDRIQLNLAQGGIKSIAGKLASRSAASTVIDTPMGAVSGSAAVVVSLVPSPQ